MQKNTAIHTLEITVLSCEDLRVNGRSVKKSTYVVVRRDPLDYRETTIDKVGGSYPCWNQKLVLDMAGQETFLTLEVHFRTPSGDTIIGSARMPVKDFMGGYLPAGYLSFLSYRLKDPKGLRNGIINVSVRERVPENLEKAVLPKPKDKCSASGSVSEPANAMVLPVDGNNSKGVVIGIPVWNANFP